MACPICKSNQYSETLFIKDYEYNINSSEKYLNCASCKLIYRERYIEEKDEENEEEPIDLDAIDNELKETKEELSIEENPEEPLADPILGLNEIDLDVPNEEGEMKLKKRNDVYYDMYKEAKRKARIARDFAIASYLEAKQNRHNFLEDDEMSEEDEKMEKELENLEKTNTES